MHSLFILSIILFILACIKIDIYNVKDHHITHTTNSTNFTNILPYIKPTNKVKHYLTFSIIFYLIDE